MMKDSDNLSEKYSSSRPKQSHSIYLGSECSDSMPSHSRIPEATRFGQENSDIKELGAILDKEDKIRTEKLP